MDQRRLDLQNLLQSLLPEGQRAYFQPPNNTALSYPCIVYNLDRIDTEYANNKPYSLFDRYSVTVIDRNPDSDIPDKVAKLPMSSWNRRFVSDKLNHTVFSLYF